MSSEALPCDWIDAGAMHTHLLCPSCGSETAKGGYASHWRCSACHAIAEAFVVCRGDGTQVRPYAEATCDRGICKRPVGHGGPHREHPLWG